MAKMVLILAACANEYEAERIGLALVNARLAACVNVVSRIASIYRWKGKVEEASEALMLVKTTRTRSAAALKKLKSMHSYELPSIVALGVEVGADEARWLNESVYVSKKR